MTGWISLNRQIQNHWIYQEKRKFSKYEAWIDLLFMVNHAPGKAVIGNRILDVDRGQRVTSIKQLAEHWDWSRSKVNTFLSMLQNDNMINFKTTSKYTLVTIVNYDFYQSDRYRKQHQYDINSTSKQHQPDTNNNDNNKNNVNKDMRALENDSNESYTHVDKSKDEFNEKFSKFYDLYAKKKARPKAEQAFKKALKKHDFETIMNGTQEFLKSIRPEDKQYQPFPATFLNQERYMDDHEPVNENVIDSGTIDSNEPSIQKRHPKKKSHGIDDLERRIALSNER